MSAPTKAKLAAALDRLVAKHPLREITVRDITEEAGVTRQVFYRYFHTRDDLIAWIYLSTFSRTFGDEPVCWGDMTLRMLEVLTEHRDFYRRLARHPDDTLERIMADLTVRLYTQMICSATAQLPDDEMLFLLKIHTVGGIRAAIDWMQGGMEMPPQRLRDLLYLSMPARLRDVLGSACISLPGFFPQK